MATLHHEITIDARAEDVWDAVRDVGALHTRLVPGFVVDTRLEAGVRGQRTMNDDPSPGAERTVTGP